MDCQKIKEYLEPFIDGELDNQMSLLVKGHIANCPLCGLELEQEKRIDSLIRQNLIPEKASFELKERILNSIEETRANLKPALAGVLAALLALAIIIPVSLNISKPFPLFTEAVLNHIEFLQGNLPVEVISNNPQEVYKWFEGKLDFTVKVPDLSKKGVILTGGRLYHIKEKRVAYLIYKTDGHNISVSVIDTSGINIPKAKRIKSGKNIFLVRNEKGYQSILCIDKVSGIGCIFVSELSEQELMRLIS